MNHITVNIKDIVKQNLNKKRHNILFESISSDDYKDDIIKNHVEKSIQMIYEGYSLSDVGEYIGKAGESINKTTGANFDFGKMFSESLLSMAKEFGIKWLLDSIGFNPTLSTVIAQGAADLSIRDLILPFKNKEYCSKHMPNLLDSILEVIVRQMGQKLLWEKLPNQKGTKNRYEWIDLFTTIPAGNVTGEIIRQTETSENLAKVICPMIHK